MTLLANLAILFFLGFGTGSNRWDVFATAAIINTIGLFSTPVRDIVQAFSAPALWWVYSLAVSGVLYGVGYYVGKRWFTV